MPLCVVEAPAPVTLVLHLETGTMIAALAADMIQTIML